MEPNWITAPLIGIFLAGLIAACVYAVTDDTIISILVFIVVFIVFPFVFSAQHVPGVKVKDGE